MIPGQLPGTSTDTLPTSYKYFLHFFYVSQNALYPRLGGTRMFSLAGARVFVSPKLHVRKETVKHFSKSLCNDYISQYRLVRLGIRPYHTCKRPAPHQVLALGPRPRGPYCTSEDLCRVFRSRAYVHIDDG